MNSFLYDVPLLRAKSSYEFTYFGEKPMFNQLHKSFNGDKKTTAYTRGGHIRCIQLRFQELIYLRHNMTKYYSTTAESTTKMNVIRRIH